MVACSQTAQAIDPTPAVKGPEADRPAAAPGRTAGRRRPGAASSPSRSAKMPAALVDVHIQFVACISCDDIIIESVDAHGRLVPRLAGVERGDHVEADTSATMTWNLAPDWLS